MAKAYLIRCRDAGVDCDFETRGASPEDVVEHCAEHSRAEHGMKGFGPDLYIKMRAHLLIIDDEATAGHTA